MARSVTSLKDSTFLTVRLGEIGCGTVPRL